MKPTVYLLCGLGGSGKSMLAQELAENGLQKFSLDEQVYSRYGRAIVDLPQQIYLQRYRAVKVELDKKLIDALKKKISSVRLWLLAAC